MSVHHARFPGPDGKQPPRVQAPPIQNGPPARRHASPAQTLSAPFVMPRSLATPTILVFDSGLGGLTVFRAIAKARPDARFVYVADDAMFPYGGIDSARLTERVIALMDGFLAAYRPDIVVIACNTASTLVLPALRQRFAVPFVGTVPAIKPACASSVTRRVTVLGTQATVKREYTQALIRQFATDCAVTLVGSLRLAEYAERELAGDPVDDETLRAEVAPCFIDDGARTDTVVLACTHYPLLVERLESVAPWPVRFIDPAPAIARRVVELVGPALNPAAPMAAALHFTSRRALSQALAKALEGFGLTGEKASPD